MKLIRPMRHAKAIISLALVACVSDKKETPADSAGAVVGIDSFSVTSPTPIPPADSSTARADTAVATEPAANEWEVTPAGIGKIKAGMTLQEVNVATNNEIDIPAKLDECAYIRPKNAPKGVALMVEKGTVSRVDITQGTVATAKGARIGDSEDRIKSLYANQVKVMPHKYTDGHYLVVTPAGGGENRIVFETDGKKVLRYRSGREPAVEYVEGCS